MRKAIGTGLVLLASALPLRAETVHLKQGGVLRGEVLRKKADRVYLDLGFTVLGIPADEIDRIVADDAAAQPAAEDAAGDLWRTEPQAPELTVKENVERCGEAVVLVRTSTGLGSGFVIHPEGYVLTNDHVVAGEHRISVTIFRQKGKELERVSCNEVRIVATNPVVDLALLKIEGAGERRFRTVPLGDSDALRQGQAVFAVGSPLGLDRTVSEGIVSLKNRATDGMTYIQATAQINPGNSGGPLFNLRGEVVGVNNMKISAAGIEGMNFAIPSSALKAFLRNRDAFAFDPRNPNSGFRYLSPPRPGAATAPKAEGERK